MFKRSTSRSNWNLEVLVFVEGEKPENPEKNPRSRERTNNKLHGLTYRLVSGDTISKSEKIVIVNPFTPDKCQVQN